MSRATRDAHLRKARFWAAMARQTQGQTHRVNREHARQHVKAARRDDINYLASFAGLGTATPADASPDEMVRGDLETARLFGERVASTAARWSATPATS